MSENYKVTAYLNKDNDEYHYITSARVDAEILNGTVQTKPLQKGIWNLSLSLEYNKNISINMPEPIQISKAIYNSSLLQGRKTNKIVGGLTPKTHTLLIMHKMHNNSKKLCTGHIIRSS